MIGATKRWFRRHRNGIAIGAGVVGAGYLVGQYVLSKILESRERMSSERIARENLRRRFEQNQTDCTFTVLALLPTAAENILEALPVEELTNELQQKKAERLARLNAGDITGSEISSSGAPSAAEDDGRSLSSFRSEGYVHTSQTAESSSGVDTPKPKSRTQLWNDLKINSLTRSFTLIYTLSLLTLLTRIQLNLLGRRNYLSSVVSLASHPQNQSTINLEDHDDEGIGHAFGNDFETNRRYLTFSWWLLHRGWQQVMGKVKEAVEEVFGSVNPREDITQERLSELTLAVRKNVEGATEEERRSTKWLSYLLPPRDLEDYVLKESGVLSTSETSSPQNASSLRHLLDETSDLIDSPQFTQILTLLNNEAFSTLIDNKCAVEAFKNTTPTHHPLAQEDQPQQPQQPQTFSSSVTLTPTTYSTTQTPTPPPPTKAKLATILAVIARQAHAIGNGTEPPNDYLSAMEQGVRELEAFAAVVYSSNFDVKLPVVSGHDQEGGPCAGETTTTMTTMSTDNANKDTSRNSPGFPATEADELDDGGVTPLGGEESIIDLGQQQQPSVSAGGGGGDGDGVENDTPSFEKVWGKAVEQQSSSSSS
ncbi:peroxin-3 [[Emmonsia] crescens]|uniref:Peroxin-3 n=1 Tax=[Emmonsia] crescens TaxID=73230 RepID=A0A2B7Z6B9_9EURO|nr:peroxin-3 [Emmonsia crescens]